MSQVISIYDAKTNLSKLIKQAEKGEVIYIGAYGHPQVVLGPIPTKQAIPVGVWADKKRPDAYNLDDMICPDTDITADFQDSINKL